MYVVVNVESAPLAAARKTNDKRIEKARAARSDAKHKNINETTRAARSGAKTSSKQRRVKLGRRQEHEAREGLPQEQREVGERQVAVHEVGSAAEPRPSGERRVQDPRHSPQGEDPQDHLLRGPQP